MLAIGHNDLTAYLPPLIPPLLSSPLPPTPQERAGPRRGLLETRLEAETPFNPS